MGDLGVATVAVGSAFGLLELALPAEAASSTYATASVAIALAALLSGLVAGVAAVALSSAVVVYAHLPPVGEIHVASAADLVGLALFALNGWVVAIISAALRARRAEGARPLATQAQLDPVHPRELPSRVPEASSLRGARLPPGFSDSLVEPLTDRELEVLALMGDGMSNEEIAAALYISTNTVKTHLKNIYGKLGVVSRTQAAARALQLGLRQRSVPDQPTAA